MDARFPPRQKTSRGDSKEVLLQRQGNEDKGVGHLGINSWYVDDEADPPTNKTKKQTKLSIIADMVSNFGLYSKIFWYKGFKTSGIKRLHIIIIISVMVPFGYNRRRARSPMSGKVFILIRESISKLLVE